MENHFQLDDSVFIEQFKKATLKPELFSHEAHLRLAWLHIKASHLDGAIDIVDKDLFNYVSQLGAKDKYHKTLTIAAIKMVGHFFEKSQSNDFKAFIDEFPRLKTNFKDLILQHYSKEIFTLREAKSTFVEPDKLPFD